MHDYSSIFGPGWETVQLIGRGGFGCVYEIRRDILGMEEKAALKVISIPQTPSDIDELRNDGYDDSGITAIFGDQLNSIVAEYALMRKLSDCANVVTCDDIRYVQHDNGCGWDIFIKMERLTPLAEALPKQIDDQTVIHVARDICNALDACKKHNIVHRDIKPQNILLSQDGLYKLGDFGIARTVEKTTGATKIGTYKFMAPEVYNNQPYGHGADVYSLGLVLYWMLNERRLPFMPLPPETPKHDEEEAARMRRFSGESLPEPLHGSKVLKQIVLKACSFDPKNRYQSAAEMLEDLNHVLNGEPVAIKVQPTAGPETKPQEASPAAEAKVSQQVETKRMAKETAPKKKSKKKMWVLIGVCAALLCAAIGTMVFLNYYNNQPTTYIDENGKEVQTISRSQMEEAYELGVRYYEQGQYVDSIKELSKVTDKSSKYGDAQITISQAKEAYAEDLIEQAASYLENGNYETALSLAESGFSIAGDSETLHAYVQSILETLKMDMIDQSAAAEKNEQYAEAFSYIQTAAAFLPDDAELQTMYVRLEAMSVAEAALADAEQFMAAEEYELAFSTLDDALVKAGDVKTAVSKLTLAYDEYKKSYLTETEKLARNAKKSLEFADAIAALEEAVQVFPEEYALQKLHGELVDLETAHTAVDKAEGMAAKEDYKNLFKTLQSALDKISSNADARKLVENSYDTYKTTYLEELNEQIGEPKTVAEFEEAIKLLEAATSILTNDADLSNKLEHYKNSKPVYLFEQDPFMVENLKLYMRNNDVSTVHNYTSGFFSWYYPAGYMMYSAGELINRGMAVTPDSSKQAKLYYNLNGKYSTLKGRMAFEDFASERIDEKYNINFYADDVLVASYTIYKSKLPIDIEVNLDKCNKLTIELVRPVGDTSDNPNINLIEFSVMG